PLGEVAGADPAAAPRHPAAAAIRPDTRGDRRADRPARGQRPPGTPPPGPGGRLRRRGVTMSSPPPESADLDALAERLAADMRRSWQAGDRPVTEDYLAAHPQLRERPEAAAELIYEEVCLRREAGQVGGSSAVVRRFPQWAPQLRLLLE